MPAGGQRAMSWFCTREAGKSLKHVTFPGLGLVCEEPLMVQMMRLTGWNIGRPLNHKDPGGLGVGG